MPTGIGWTDETWNPTTGCDRVSDGCTFCYALTMAGRLKKMGQKDYQTDGDPRTSGPGFGVAMHEHRLDQPLRWRKPRMVFVDSMSDLFHPKISDDFIARVFAVMAASPRHTFQVLTKRHARMRSLLSNYAWWTSVVAFALEHTDRPLPTQTQPDGGCALSNVWLGVSVELQRWADVRIPALLDTPAVVRFISAEPLLGPIDLDNCGGYQAVTPEPDRSLTYLDWVILGGESGPGARPIHPDWARDLITQCENAGTAVWFKQWGAWAPAPWKPVKAPEESELDYQIRCDQTGATHAYSRIAHEYKWHVHCLSHAPWSAERSPTAPIEHAGLRRVGGHGGNIIDGRLIEQFPRDVVVS